jgi:hypothetical protein
VITGRDLEVISDKFNILGTCCGGNYDQKKSLNCMIIVL